MKLCVDGFGNPMKGYDWFIRGEMRSSKNKAAADLRELKAKLKELEKVTKQRDELLAALEVLLRDVKACNAAGQYGLELMPGINQAESVIASVKGDAA